MNNKMVTINKESKSILITGGLGFIGSHIVEHFIKNGHNVWVVDNESSFNSGYRNDNAIYIKEDIRSDKLEEIFQDNHFDICIHLAAQASVTSSIKDPINDASINILGSINIIKLCKKYNCSKFIAASSAAVYGNPKHLPIDENHSTDVLSPYGLSKLTMEKYIQLSGVPYIICRFSNVYGERQNAFGEAGVVSIFDDAMLNGKNVFIDGDGKQSRDFIYVKDVADIIYRLCSSEIKNEIFNISTNTSCTINELFKTMAKVYGYKKEPIYRASRIGDIKESILDNKKLKRLPNIDKLTSSLAGLNNLHNYSKTNSILYTNKEYSNYVKS